MTVAFVFYSPSLFNKTFFASPAGRLRNRNAAAFSPLKKYAAHFFNHAFGVTGEKEAANPVTVGIEKLAESNDFYALICFKRFVEKTFGVCL